MKKLMKKVNLKAVCKLLLIMTILSISITSLIISINNANKEKMLIKQIDKLKKDHFTSCEDNRQLTDNPDIIDENKNDTNKTLNGNKKVNELSKETIKSDSANGIYTLKFNLDGGDYFFTVYGGYKTMSNYSFSYTNNTKISDYIKMFPNASKKGYVLDGWYTDKNCTGNMLDKNTVLNFGANKEIWPCWKETVSVSIVSHTELYGDSSWNQKKGISIRDSLKDHDINVNDVLVKSENGDLVDINVAINNNIKLVLEDK